MNELLEVLKLQKFYDEEGGNGTGSESTDGTDGKEPTNQENQETKPYKAFQTEEEFNNALKSERSKAKNEILKQLGVKSVDEGTTNLTKAEKLEQDLQATVTRLSQMEEENALVKTGIDEQYRDEALTLARSKVNDETSLQEALSQVVEKFPNLKGKTNKKGVTKVGSESDKGEEDNKQDNPDKDFKESLTAKYPWLKL